MMQRYWVDANVFIWGHREPYPLPGAQAYWNWFEGKIDGGYITSHWKAISEVIDGDNNRGTELIVTWLKARMDKIIATPDNQECQDLVGKMCAYSYETFGSVRTVEFTRGADLWLIARAKLDGGAVVTQESTTKLVRIPTICNAFDIRHISLFQMNRELKMTLG